MGAKVSKQSSVNECSSKASDGLVNVSSASDCVSREEDLTIIELFMPECVKAKKVMKKSTKRSNNIKVEMWSLEDCLLASPSLNPNSINDCELCVLRQATKSVHPSWTSPSIPEAKERLALERLVLLDREADNDYLATTPVKFSSIRRNGSIKSTKRVTFKPPEEDDIILFYSPAHSLHV